MVKYVWKYFKLAISTVSLLCAMLLWQLLVEEVAQRIHYFQHVMYSSWETYVQKTNSHGIAY